MKKLILLILGISLIGLTSAITIYSGTSYSWDFSNYSDDIVSITYSISGNSTNLEGLDFDVNIPYVVMSIPLNFEEDNFLITFLINEEYYVYQDFGNGGSGGSSTCYTEWNCSSWSKCQDGYANRECSKIKEKCKTKLEKPNEEIECVISIGSLINESKESQEIEKENNIQENNNEIIKEKKKFKKFILPIIISSLLGIIILISYIIERRKKKNAEKESIVE